MKKSILQMLNLEKKHKQGYRRHPVKEGEFDILEASAVSVRCRKSLKGRQLGDSVNLIHNDRNR